MISAVTLALLTLAAPLAPENAEFDALKSGAKTVKSLKRAVTALVGDCDLYDVAATNAKPNSMRRKRGCTRERTISTLVPPSQTSFAFTKCAGPKRAFYGPPSSTRAPVWR